MPRLTDPLALPCGAILPNRIAKAALTEGLADAWGRATQRHQRLYRRWSEGGCGMLLTGNIQVDRWHLERPGNVCVDDNGGLEELAAYARAATAAGNQCWVQISHAGRQTPRNCNPLPAGPSAIGLEGGLQKRIAPPRALTTEEVAALPAAFAHVAATVKAAGFTGVQLHAAHGYQFSAFLSPKANRRTDRYGGSLENRSRLLLNSLAAVRAAVGPAFPVSVKLNSSDFQQDGFTFEECSQVVRWLEAGSVDLIEVSGGTYENPVLLSGQTGQPVRASTAAREAYFLEFAEALAGMVTVPLMVTGGFRTRAGMQAALDGGAAQVIGLGRPLCVEPDLPLRLLAGTADAERGYEQHVTGSQAILWYYAQLLRLGDGLDPDPALDVKTAAETVLAHDGAQAAALTGRRPHPALAELERQAV